MTFEAITGKIWQEREQLEGRVPGSQPKSGIPVPPPRPSLQADDPSDIFLHEKIEKSVPMFSTDEKLTLVT